MAWGEWEAELTDDMKQWKSGHITKEEKNHIVQILRLFTQSDFVVENNYIDALLPVFKNNEIRMMLTSFAEREGTHQRAYALLNDTLGMDEAEYSTFLSNTDMNNKVSFMSDNIAPAFSTSELTTQYNAAYSLAKSVCNEGMSLFSAFAMLLNYQRQGKMKGMCTIVDWSIKDETLHLEGLVKLFQVFCQENSKVVNNHLKKSLYLMYKEAVTLEDKIIDLSFEAGPIKGLTVEEMKTYIRYIADRRLTQLGLKPIWNIKTNPLSWLDYLIGGISHKNFFEGRIDQYIAGGLTGDWNWDNI